jgi:hypothetical protein
MMVWECMAFLRDIELLRRVQWSQGYLWDVKIVDKPFGGLQGETDDPALRLPKPFDEWFPAQDVEDAVANLETYTIEAAQAAFEIPIKTTQHEIKLTFVDDAAHQLLSFFENWIERTILKEGAAIATLQESVKLLQLVKLDSERNIIEPKTKTYWVFPKGHLSFHGTGDANPLSYTVTLVKAGHAPA